MNMIGLFFLIFGSAAVALMGFRAPEIGQALRLASGRQGSDEDRRRAANFCEAAARNAWKIGALGSTHNFTIVLCLSGERGQAEISVGMIRSLVTMLYGLVLAALCLVPAMKLAEGPDVEVPDAVSGRADKAAAGRSRIVGYPLFVATLVATVVLLLAGRKNPGPVPFSTFLLHGPAVLVVIGGAVVLAFFMGRGVGARAWTLGFAMTGAMALLTGLIQALTGFAHKNIAEIASAVGFVITAIVFALLGLTVVAAPLEDREVMAGRRDKAGPISRALWIIFPVLAFVSLVLTFIMVITPITKPAG